MLSHQIITRKVTLSETKGVELGSFKRWLEFATLDMTDDNLNCTLSHSILKKEIVNL